LKATGRLEGGKELATFARDKQSKEEIFLHNCLNFVQAVQDAVDQYEWQEAGVFITVASCFTGFASAWFRDWRLNHATNLTWRQLLETNSCETDFKIKDFFIKP
jgi:hypothetical protein